MHGAQIENFWEWFGKYVAVLQAVIDDNHHPKLEEVVEGLNQHILGMGKLKWELNSPTEKQYTLTISPNSNRDLLKITRAIIGEAPSYSNWSFYYALQATKAVEISVYDNDMEHREVDASQWKIVLESEADGRNFLIIKADNLNHLDEDIELIAVDLILTAVLGEELKIKRVAGFDVVTKWDAVQKMLAFPIQDLETQLG